MPIKNKNFFLLLFFSELWERFSYYGMRALLVLYLTSILGFSDKSAYSIYALFAALGYAGPVIGGIIADKLLGFRNMIKLGAIIITAGHATLAFMSAEQTFLLYLGLALIAVGTGFFKGNISNLLGMCYSKDDPKRDKAFSLFYVSVNLGSFVSSIACGLIAKQYGWEYGFGLAGVGMLLGLIIFIKFEDMLGNVGIMTAKQQLLNKKYKTKTLIYMLAILLAISSAFMLSYSHLFTKALVIVGISIYAYMGKMLFSMDTFERKNIILLMVITVFLMLFFSVEMQLGALFNLFTARNVDTTFLGYEIPAASLQSLNPMSILLFGPLLAPLFVRLGIGFSMMRIGLGVLSMIASLLILYIGCLYANSDSMVSIIYLIASMCIMGVGELLLAPLIQDLYTRLAPKRMRGFMMGLLLLSLSFSNLAGNIIAMFVSVETGSTGEINVIESLAIYQKGFGEFTICGIVILLIFGFLYPILNAQYMSNFRKISEDESLAENAEALADA